MSQLRVVSEEKFRMVLGKRLGQHIDRAVGVLNNFGPRLSHDVVNVILHSIDQGKEDEVLTILDEHWKEHLQFEHPDIRGTVENMLGVNETQQMFLRTYQNTLGLTPTQAAI